MTSAWRLCGRNRVLWHEVFYAWCSSPQRSCNAPLVGSGGDRDKGGKTMSTITTQDGTQIYYKDWGEGQAIVFSHGWPLNGDAWESQMLFLVQNGYRTIAHDRRGHGRSSQPSGGNDMDTYADDLAALFEELNLKDAVMVGHSTGGGEVTRFIGRHKIGRAHV